MGFEFERELQFKKVEEKTSQKTGNKYWVIDVREWGAKHQMFISQEEYIKFKELEGQTRKCLVELIEDDRGNDWKWIPSIKKVKSK